MSDFLAGRSVRPGRDPAKPSAAQSSSLDLSTSSRPTATADPLNLSRPTNPQPATSNPLDLSSPAPQPAQSPAADPLDLSRPAQARPSAQSNLLDLGESTPAQTTPPTTQPSNPLDLSSPATAGATGSRPQGRYAPLVSHELGLPTIAEGERRILTIDDPVVHLTRMQSSAGSIDFSPATPAPNQLLLGCAFETTDKRESMVLPGLHPQGPDLNSPVFRVSTQGLTINLRGITTVERFFVIGLPQTSDRSMPGGTLVIRTYGGSRVEVVLDTCATYGAKALVTGYVVEGRIVLRAEHDPFSGTLQQVAGVYGYDQMTWRDPFTPLF